ERDAARPSAAFCYIPDQPPEPRAVVQQTSLSGCPLPASLPGIYRSKLWNSTSTSFGTACGVAAATSWLLHSKPTTRPILPPHCRSSSRLSPRSEERRVGKASRSARAADD